MANAFRDELKPKFGLATITPKLGQSFDKNNDLYLGHDGKIYPRHDWQGSVIDASERVSLIGACADALIAYNKATMTREEFNDFYGDDPSELVSHDAR